MQQFTASQDAQLQTLQQQAAAAQSQAAQAAAQLDNAQTQVAEASDQLQSQNTQVSSLNTATQSNVQELAVLLPTTPSGAPAPGPEAAQGALPLPSTLRPGVFAQRYREARCTPRRGLLALYRRARCAMARRAARTARSWPRRSATCGEGACARCVAARRLARRRTCAGAVAGLCGRAPA